MSECTCGHGSRYHPDVSVTTGEPMRRPCVVEGCSCLHLHRAPDPSDATIARLTGEVERLRAIVRAFAESDPWTWSDTTGTRRCDHCGASRPTQHTEACAWKRAIDEPPTARKESGE